MDVTEAVLRPNPRLGPAVLELFRDVPKEADSGWLVMAGDDGVGGNGSGGGGEAPCVPQHDEGFLTLWHHLLHCCSDVVMQKQQK